MGYQQKIVNQWQASQYSSKKEPRNVKNPAFNAQEASFSEFLKGTKSQKLISAKYSDVKVLEELLSGSKHSKETYSDISSKKKKKAILNFQTISALILKK